MHNPFKPSATLDLKPAPKSIGINSLLFLLASIAAYMLATDVIFLLKTEQGSLRGASSVSFIHHIYLSAIPFEAAYFRLGSSIAALLFIIFSARNNQLLAKHALFLHAYAATQLTYQILAITGVAGILSQAAGTSSLDISFWFHPDMRSNTAMLLFKFALLLLSPIAFFILSLIALSKIRKHNSLSFNAIR
ncbi:hypothetical protein [Pseudomonas anguilliseptica]|uniref:hypothetical protein n=1 Tax=Pseudomonas anguilliseptica TaxID=53406 RepID=UPI0037369FDB